MIACKRGRISIAFVLVLLAAFYLALFMFPSKFLGMIIRPEADVFVMEDVIHELENSSKVSVIVTIKDSDTLIQSVISTLNEDEFKPEYQYSIINGFSGKITKEGIEAIRGNPDVQAVYLDEENEFFLDSSAPLINATNVWSMQHDGINMTGKGISVCVIDSGINYSHPALAGRVIAGYNFVNNTEDFMDNTGHGTIVSGVIASTDPVYRGIAPEANLIAMKISSDSDIIAAIEWCLDNATKYNISVISMSVGWGTYGNQSECDALPVSQAANKAKSKNVIVVAASGNSGHFYKNVMARPACASNVTSVSATLDDDSIWQNSETAYFLDLLAPGNVTSLGISSGFASGCGTSLAAPHVAGAAALIYQYERLVSNLNATPDEAEKILKLGGKQIYDSDVGMSFPRINVLNSINLIYTANISDNSFYSNEAKVKFNSNTNLEGVTEAFDISYNSISLNSSKHPQFNKSANLTLYNLIFEKNPLILKDGNLCSDCSAVSYNHNFTFIVQSFTNYSAGANSELAVWDSSDSGMPYFSGNSTVRENQTAFFYANYTNRTSGVIESLASCNITFYDYSANLSFNPAKNLLEYPRNFSLAGQKSYSINCSSSDFEPLESSGSVWVSNCIYPGENTIWIINESTGNVTCMSENLFINQSNLLVQSGYSLALEDTNLTLIQGNNRLNVSQNAHISLDNSVIVAVGLENLAINVYGTADIDHALFNNTQVYFAGNKSSVINNSVFHYYVYFKENSTVSIHNSNFTGDVYFGEGIGDSASATVQNSIFSGTTLFRRNTTANFIAPASNITFVLSIASSGSNIPVISGNVEIAPSIIIGSTSKIQRQYPVNVLYNGTETGICNKSINITITSTGELVWNGTTNSSGFALANMTLNSSNYGNGNFTISVNPSSDISLTTPTPIIFELDDLDAPEWSNNGTSPDPGSDYNPSQAYQFSVDWNDNVALSRVLIEHNFSGSLQNNSMSNSGSHYYYDFSSLAAGNYQWRSYANDTSGNLNHTDIWNYTVNAAPGQVSLLLNGSSGNLDLVYGSQINASASTQYGTLNLYRDSIAVNAENNNYVLLGVGYYNYTAVSTGNQNYSQSSITRFVNITKTASSVNLSLNGIDGDINVNVNANVDINATLVSPASGTLNLYLSNNLINNGSSSLKNSTSFSSVGTYNVTSYYPGNDNYSSSSHTHFITVQAVSNPQQPPGGGGGGGGGAPETKNQTSLSDLLKNFSQRAGCSENWSCSEWNACIKGEQTRACLDLNNCSTSFQKPSETQTCEMPTIPIETNSFRFNLLWLLPFLIIFIILAWWLRENELEILIRRAVRAIKRKKYSRARKIYIKIHEIYMKLPDRKKRKYHERIAWIYAHLKR